MAIDWALGFKVLQPLAQWGGAAYNRIFGSRPTIDFEVGEYGPELRVKNTRSDTIIIERAGSKPSLLGFAIGHEIHDVVEAVIDQRGGEKSHATAVLGPPSLMPPRRR
jgi:hypothetical protein